MLSERYKGRLSRKKILCATELCLENAESLIEDAKALFGRRSFARAVALCVLSFEELGKIPLLMGALMYNKDEQWGTFWKRFRDHRSKRKVVATIEADLWRTSKAERRQRDVEEEIERMKLLCLYVDVVNGKVYSPMHAFGPRIETMAVDAIKFAEGRASMFKSVVQDQIPPEVRIAMAKGLQKILDKKIADPDAFKNALERLVEQLAKNRKKHTRS